MLLSCIASRLLSLYAYAIKHMNNILKKELFSQKNIIKHFIFFH
ncbi:hypothetical protein AMI01nite_27840 [Aneurinibacillus migulanus]|nr:hypothetical protein AMI01nite_27840 [Aneurinibacillus migulanus]